MQKIITAIIIILSGSAEAQVRMATEGFVTNKINAAVSEQAQTNALFTAWLAGISGQTNLWNEAWSWNNHALAGYAGTGAVAAVAADLDALAYTVENLPMPTFDRVIATDDPQMWLGVTASNAVLFRVEEQQIPDGTYTLTFSEDFRFRAWQGGTPEPSYTAPYGGRIERVYNDGTLIIKIGFDAGMGWRYAAEFWAVGEETWLEDDIVFIPPQGTTGVPTKLIPEIEALPEYPDEYARGEIFITANTTATSATNAVKVFASTADLNAATSSIPSQIAAAVAGLAPTQMVAGVSADLQQAVLSQSQTNTLFTVWLEGISGRTNLWNQAWAWGNHALAGYASTQAVSEVAAQLGGKLDRVNGTATNLSVSGSLTLNGDEITVWPSGGASDSIATPITYATAPIAITATQALYWVELSSASTVSNTFAGLTFDGSTRYEWREVVNIVSNAGRTVTWDARRTWLDGVPDLTVTGRYEFALSTVDGVRVQARQTWPECCGWVPAITGGRNSHTAFGAELFIEHSNASTTNDYVVVAAPFRLGARLVMRYNYYVYDATAATNTPTIRAAWGNIGAAPSAGAITNVLSAAITGHTGVTGVLVGAIHPASTPYLFLFATKPYLQGRWNVAGLLFRQQNALERAHIESGGTFPME